MKFSLGEAKALLEFFGGHNASVTVEEEPEETGADGTVYPAGKYAFCTDCPEEGSVWLGPHDTETEKHNTGPLKVAAG